MLCMLFDIVLLALVEVVKCWASVADEWRLGRFAHWHQLVCLPVRLSRSRKEEVDAVREEWPKRKET